MPSAKTVFTVAIIAAATIYALNRFTEGGVTSLGKPPELPKK